MKGNSKKPVFPTRLKPGDTIGIIAPASSFDNKKFEQGLSVLNAMGFELFVPADLFREKGYLAGPDAHRAELVTRLFSDPGIDAICCARGGFGSIRTLPLLDYDLIRMHPKICVGFSDISALLSALYTRCSLVTLHGPVVTVLGEASSKTIDHLYHAMTTDEALKMVPEKGRTLRPGLARGPVAGGNLTSLCQLLGTPFQPDFKGHVLILEERGEKEYRIDRMLSQMKLAGCFDQLAGLVLGSFMDCGEEEGIFRIVDNIFQNPSMPILAGFDFGHGQHNLTIPLGIPATLDANRRGLFFEAPATKMRAKT